MPEKTTISVIKCDVGSLAGHHTVPKPLLEIGEKRLKKAQEKGLINSHYVFHAGDDLELLMVHKRGENNAEIHKLAWNTFQEAAKKASDLKLYGAGQDLLKTAFSGNIRGMGPGVAEMEIEERGSDPIVVFAADKTEPGAFNYPMFRIFADPMSTAGLVIDPDMAGGFKFEVLDLIENKKIIIGDVFQSENLFLQLYGDGEAYIIYPSEYIIETVSPTPYDRNDSTRTLRWLGTNDFVSELRIILREKSVTPGLAGTLHESAFAIAGFLTAAVGISVGFYLYKRHTREEKKIRPPEFPTPLGVENAEDKIVRLLDSSSGSLYQSVIVRQCRFSKAKTSQLLSILEKKAGYRVFRSLKV